jgi:hypothetical protein
MRDVLGVGLAPSGSGRPIAQAAAPLWRHRVPERTQGRTRPLETLSLLLHPAGADGNTRVRGGGRDRIRGPWPRTAAQPCWAARPSRCKTARAGKARPGPRLTRAGLPDWDSMSLTSASARERDTTHQAPRSPSELAVSTRHGRSRGTALRGGSGGRCQEPPPTGVHIRGGRSPLRGVVSRLCGASIRVNAEPSGGGSGSARAPRGDRSRFPPAASLPGCRDRRS